jgi:putative molybdopterin biosynthesis protein
MPDDILYKPADVAKKLNISRFTVYELIKRGELPVYRIGRSMRIKAADLEVYMYKAKADEQPLDGQYFDNQGGIIICGQDVVLDILSSHLEKRVRNVQFLRRYIGSISGLVSLYNRSAHIATTHLWDGDSDEYNVPYVRRYLPGQKASVVNLVYRMEGFYVAPGNPKHIVDWHDLIRPDVRFVNRGPGAGARVLLDEKLRQLNIDARNIQGYLREEISHLTVASCVARGEADVGLGTEKAALQVRNVEFIPLQKERYDLVVLSQYIDTNHFQTLLSILRSEEFRKEVAGMSGYDISQMGEIIAEL